MSHKPFMRQRGFVISSTFVLLATASFAVFFKDKNWWVVFAIMMVFTIMGYRDMIQKRHAVRRIFPIFGRLRYLLEELRPKFYQYFVESDINGRPFNRLDRSVIYQRAKHELETVPFGTQYDVYEEGYEWMCQSVSPAALTSIDPDPRITIGNKDCTQPYSASIYNISAMSFGALSGRAVESLNWGAKLGNFAQNTGEGGISPYHLKYGGDLIFQVGTAYFGCRDKDGKFDPELFTQKALLPSVKMIEIKVSQGAKPGHGGVLPAIKNTEEIARIRHLEPHTKIVSPAYHTAYSSPLEMVKFIQKVREMSGGKPVGFKIVIGHKSQFISICQAMVHLDIYPDFITVDGSEGGTGAAPLEFTHYVGAPLLDALAFVHNILVGMGIKKHIKVIASGKITNGFHILRAMALGADACNSARGMMMAIGCIQSLLCNTNRCPTGITTHDPTLTVGLVVEDKKDRVVKFHQGTMDAFVELLASTGLSDMHKITRSHIYRRVSLNDMETYEEIFPSIEPGSLLDPDKIPEKYTLDFKFANMNDWNASVSGF